MPRLPHSPDLIAAALADLAHFPVAGAYPAIRPADLRSAGLSKRAVRAALAAGLLLRARRGRYVLPGAPADVIAAAREGALVTCLSALAPLGVFVLANRKLHLHFPPSAPKKKPPERTAVWHWAPLIRRPHPRATTVDLIDALIQATICQAPRAAVATLDSALNLGLIDADDLDEIFARVPARRRVLQRFVDGRAESGPESLVRLIALALGFSVEVQVVVRGVGRVDLLLDGWLVVECDSEAFHTGWASQRRDRRRDLALAALGMTSLRPIAEDIMYTPDLVAGALRGLRDARRAAGRTAIVPQRRSNGARVVQPRHDAPHRHRPTFVGADSRR